jgi:hypothetical protein
VGFSVVIAASAPVENGGIVHAVTVIQPVQTWTVIRGQDDFQAVATSLAPILPGLPPCPDVNVDAGDINSIIQARNSLQQWLASILMYPGARESPSVHNFLAYAANMIPPQYENLPWTMFTANGQVASVSPATSTSQPASDEHHQQGTEQQSQPPSSPEQSSVQQQLHTSSISPAHNDDFDGHLDDMMMDDMFDGGDEVGPSPDESDDEEEYRASIRYKATDEPITEEDEMDIANAIKGEVEMIEDVGSLAQSLGASYLGRSLKLQQEMTAQQNHVQQQQFPHHLQPQAKEGLQMGNAFSGASSGGIGGAMERAPPGLGGSFNQTKPEPPPRLDAFKMVKVIGKGSFGM